MSEPDIFLEEQRVYDRAMQRTGESEAYWELAREYGRLLRHLRRATKIADHTAKSLYESNLTLTGKIYRDAMTGIHNRRFLEEHMAETIRSLARSGGLLSVVMLDVDFFKGFNDTYGHSEGDDCLRAIASSIEESLQRTDDIVARYGGEEFVVLLPSTGEAGARVVTERILEAVRAKRIPHELSSVAPYVTISAGFTSATVEYGQTGEEYIRRADEALYLSKHGGRNRHSFLPLLRED